MATDSRPPIVGYRFGPFELDPRSGELRRHGLKVRLRGRPVDILVSLIERRGEVVTREDLRARLWTSDTFVDFDHGLNSSTNKLREALGDTAENPRYVETVPRRGYRFVAPVEVVTAPDAAAPGRNADVQTDVAAQNGASRTAPAVPVAPARARGVRWRPIAVVACLLISLGAMGFLVRQRGWLPARDRAMLIVLPFENRSGNADDEFFSDGITDEMIAQLGALDPKRLGVIARTTAMQYKGSRKGVTEIGRELGVDYLLEGSVRRDARRVRITAELVDVRSQTQLWTETYERDVSDVLMLQRDVAGRVAQSLAGGVLSPVLARATRRSPSFAAYERVLKGRAYRQQGTETSARQCIAMFEEATALDAEYAGAYAGLADCYRLLGGPGWEVGPPLELLAQARAAADRALDLDPELPEGYAARGMVRFTYDWDLAAADRDLSRAIALNPSYARAHQYRSAVLTTMGRFEEAVASAARACDLDPLSASESTTLGVRLYYSGRYADAELQLQKTLLAHPEFPAARWGLGETYREMGRLDDAVRELREATARADQSPYMRAWLAHALAAAGQREDAEAIRGQLTTESGERYVAPFLFALMASGFGERDVALEWLDKVRTSRSGWIPFLPVEPEFTWLRRDPRFAALSAGVKR
jgi:TolB-like protein/DNA-binding winged helix-turn-helix (wHTH) protein/tetratricopeptide (TPR) repeat protein